MVIEDIYKSCCNCSDSTSSISGYQPERQEVREKNALCVCNPDFQMENSNLLTKLTFHALFSDF